MAMEAAEAASQLHTGPGGPGGKQSSITDKCASSVEQFGPCAADECFSCHG